MKILQINDTLGDVGGAERSFAATCRLLEKNGHQLAILGSSQNETFLSLFQRWFSLKYYQRTVKIIKDLKPDIIHCHNLSRIVSVSPLLAAARHQVPAVMTLRDPHLFCAKSWAITKKGETCPGFSPACLLRCRGNYDTALAMPYYFLKYLKCLLHRRIIDRHSTHFICPSGKIFELVQRNFSRPLARASYLPNFIDLDRQIDPEPVSGTKKFLFVGRLAKVKGVDVALRALALVIKDKAYSQIRLEIIGDGPCRKELEKLSADLNLNERVEFIGKVENEKLSKYYQDCAAVLLPSLWIENNPRVALEAMKYARAVIASRQGGLIDLVEDQKSGFLFETANAEELAEQIKLLYDSRELAASLGQAAYQKLLSAFTPEIHYQKLMSIYNRCIQETPDLRPDN